MPHTWNNIVVVTMDDIVPNWYNVNTLRSHILRGKIKKVRIGGNGHPMLIAFDSLPDHVKNALGDPRNCDHFLERFYREDGEAVAYFTTYRFADTGLFLKVEHKERYIVNASVLKAVAYYEASQALTKKSKKAALELPPETLCQSAASFNKTLRIKHLVQHTLPAGERQFNIVLNAFKTDGFASLVSKKHGNSNTRKVTDETLALLQNMFAGQRHKPTATDVHRSYNTFMDGTTTIINGDTGEQYTPEQFKKLSNSTVKKYLTSWGNKIGTYAKRGGDRQKYMQQFKPYHSLDKPKYAGSIISIDDRQPPFKTPDGKRVWFYNGIDLGSEAFICWVHGATKGGIIIEFYRQLVRNYAQWGFNLPFELECEASLNSSFKDTFLREGAMFQRVRIEANNARGKRIERYFRTLRYEVEKDRTGWLARPFAQSEANQPGSKEAPAIHYGDIVRNALTDIEAWNNKPHSVHTHMSRWEVFCKMQHPDLKPTNYAAILPYVGYKTITSCNVGIIHLNRGEYLLGVDGKIALGETLIGLMKKVEGNKVEVYWLDDEDGNVLKAMVFMGTQLVCEAIAKPTYNRATLEQTDDGKDNRTIMSAYAATIDGYGRKRKNDIDRVLLIDERPKPKKDFVMKGLNKDKPKKETGIPLPELPEDMLEPIPHKSWKTTLLDRY